MSANDRVRTDATARSNNYRNLSRSNATARIFRVVPKRPNATARILSPPLPRVPITIGTFRVLTLPRESFRVVPKRPNATARILSRGTKNQIIKSS
jgi:hypothetical protein